MEDHTLSGVSNREKRKKQQMMSLQNKIEKTDTREVIYNTKRDSGFQTKTNN